MRGEERFTVDWDRRDDRVRYEVASYSRPAALRTRVALPIVRRLQRRFVRESCEALTRATGRDYAALLERHVSAPRRLPRTTARADRLASLELACDHAGPSGARRAYPVVALTPAPERGDGWITPAGGVVSTAEELVALALALPSSASWSALSRTSEVRGEDGPRTVALAGLARALPDSGDMSYRSSGNTGAQASELHWVPTRGFAVAVTANIGRPYRATVDAAFRVALGEPAYAPADDVSAAPDTPVAAPRTPAAAPAG